MTKPSRFLENGLAAPWGGSFCTDSAESSENRIRLSGLIEPSVADAQRRVGLAAPDRLEAELDRARARGAGGRQRDRRALGAEGGGERLGDRSEHEALMIGTEAPARGGAQQIVVVHRRVGAGGLGKLFALQPFDSFGATARNSGPGKWLRDPIPDCAIASSMASSARRSAIAGRRQRLHGEEIDGACDLGLEAVGGKAGDGDGCRTRRQ